MPPRGCPKTPTYVSLSWRGRWSFVKKRQGTPRGGEWLGANARAASMLFLPCGALNTLKCRSRAPRCNSPRAVACFTLISFCCFYCFNFDHLFGRINRLSTGKQRCFELFRLGFITWRSRRVFFYWWFLHDLLNASEFALSVNINICVTHTIIDNCVITRLWLANSARRERVRC